MEFFLVKYYFFVKCSNIQEIKSVVALQLQPIKNEKSNGDFKLFFVGYFNRCY